MRTLSCQREERCDEPIQMPATTEGAKNNRACLFPQKLQAACVQSDTTSRPFLGLSLAFCVVLPHPCSAHETRRRIEITQTRHMDPLPLSHRAPPALPLRVAPPEASDVPVPPDGAQTKPRKYWHNIPVAFA